MVPAGFRLAVDGAGARVIEDVVLRHAHVARQAVEQLVALIQLVFEADVRQQLVVGLVAFFRPLGQAAVVGAFAFDVHEGQAADQCPVRGEIPGVLSPDFLCRRHGIAVTALDLIAIGIDHVVRIRLDAFRLTIALQADEGLSLRLARAFIPVADLYAVLVVDVPVQLGGDARTPGLGARRPVINASGR